MTDREKREKVVRGLECCIAYDYKCSGCPYRDDGGAEDGCYSDELKADALALLKAQEPRVMTLEEAQGADYCWYESRTANICILCSAVMYHKSNGKPKTEFQQIGTEILGFQYDDEYGKRWRCWDKEPTRALREATPWE